MCETGETKSRKTRKKLRGYKGLCIIIFFFTNNNLFRAGSFQTSVLDVSTITHGTRFKYNAGTNSGNSFFFLAVQTRWFIRIFFTPSLCRRGRRESHCKHATCVYIYSKCIILFSLSSRAATTKCCSCFS